MDTIRFEKTLVWVDTGDIKKRVVGKIIINEKPLIDTIRVYEQPFAIEENHESLAGGYMYRCASRLYKELTGQNPSKENSLGIPILICGSCCMFGCWELFVHIDETASEVIWFNFYNFARSGRWDYSRFPIYRFDKIQYAIALEELREKN